MLRRSVAAALLVAAGVLPLLAVTLGWRWFVDGPAALVLAAGAGYAAGAWLPRVPAVVGVLVAVTGLVTANQLDDAGYHWLDDLLFFLVLVAGPAGVAAAVAVRAGQVRQLDSLRARLHEQRRADVAAARLETSSRVHEELHTRLAERIAGIAVLAEGARSAADVGVLAQVESEARGVLDQLRAALGSLDEGDPEPPPAEPSPEMVHPHRVRASTLDVAVAGALGAALAVEAVVGQAARGPVWANVLAAGLVAAPLLVRRARPVAAAGATTATASLMSLWLTPVTFTVTGVALLTVVFYSVGAFCRGRSWVVGWLVAAAGTVATGVVAGWVGAQERDPVWIVLVWAVAATLLGRVAGHWQERVHRIDATVTALEQGRGAAVRLARAQERAALASELHDTVAHAMTAVCLQAGAHRRPGGDPTAALSTIVDSAVTSLAELRDGLDTIGTSGHPLDASSIVALGRRVGVDVDVRGPAPVVAGPAASLALRVLREAIVNIARHAPGASAQVLLTGGPGTVGVEVRDAGGVTGTDPVLRGSGTGLAGLARAVGSAGGTLEWGPCRTGGFRVAATIPEACR